MSKVDLFIEEFVALVKGDDAAALGARVKRQGISALESHISSLNGDTMDLESDVDLATENLKKARLNHGKSIDAGKEARAEYVNNILKAVNAKTKAEETLDVHKKKIETLQSQLQQISM